MFTLPRHPQFATFATFRMVPGQYPDVAKSSHVLAAKAVLTPKQTKNRQSNPIAFIEAPLLIHFAL
jgi:hypothetical protein